MSRITIQVINKIVNYTMLTIIVMLMAFAGYAFWDSKQIYRTADKSQYAVYKPTVENEEMTFKELQALNPEVFAWLTVFGTNIDYPVTQGEDNMKYVNTNAEGLYSLSGSIFLDYKNSKDFTDFNNILYGHHMEKKTMFGEIGYFSDENVFEAHMYGNLYFDGKDHGIEFFAFTHINAYDGVMFKANAIEDIRHVYLGQLLETAKHKREIGVTTEDRIVLLTTCSSASTNGRDILAGRITDKTFEDPFIKADTDNGTGLFDKDKQYGLLSEVLLWLPLLILIIIARLIYILVANLTNKHTNRRMTESRNY